MKTYTEKQTEEEHTIYQTLGYKIKIQGLIKKENKTYQSILVLLNEMFIGVFFLYRSRRFMRTR